MITQPTVLEKDSNEYYQLKIACQYFKELTEDMDFKIQDIYFDMGQGWMWTTIVAYNLQKGGDSFQVLNPSDWKEIISDLITNADIKNICIENMNEYPSLWNFKTSEEK